MDSQLEKEAKAWVDKHSPTENSWVDYDLSYKAYLAGHLSARRWIPLSEAKPDALRMVLVLLKTGGYDIAFSKSDHFDLWMAPDRYYRVEEIAHWMPLPEAP